VELLHIKREVKQNKRVKVVRQNQKMAFQPLLILPSGYKQGCKRRFKKGITSPAYAYNLRSYTLGLEDLKL
jgi:hypothetical protein